MNTQLTKPLYQIRQDHYELLSHIEESGGELTPEIEQALQLSEEEFESKAVSYAYVIKGFDGTEDIIDKEIERLSELKEKAVKRKELFKQRLSDAMQQFGVEKIETPTLKLSFRKSESIEITDVTKIAGKYLEEKKTYTISKIKIKESIKEGISVPGAELKTNYNLQIK